MDPLPDAGSVEQRTLGNLFHGTRGVLFAPLLPPRGPLGWNRTRRAGPSLCIPTNAARVLLG